MLAEGLVDPKREAGGVGVGCPLPHTVSSSALACPAAPHRKHGREKQHQSPAHGCHSTSICCHGNRVSHLQSPVSGTNL